MFKGHFISVLAGVADGFPINQWDELLPQTMLTLNLLRQSNVAPNISAYAYHHGSFDYNQMPLAPMGCNILRVMGHSQPLTPVQTDNSTVEGIINLQVQPKRTKAMAMRFHWLRDQGVNQKQF
jgi:hypothetical protein